MTITQQPITHTRNPARARDLMWPGAIGFILLLGILSGGSSQAASPAFHVFRLLCVLLFAAALFRLVNLRLSKTEKYALALAIVAVMLVVIHLVPLPFRVFADLPGRSYVATAFATAGIPERWMPLSLSPENTWACLLALLPPLAVFLATLSVNSRGRWLLAGTILVGAFANVMLGLAQRFQGPKSTLYLYEFANLGLATGFFSNRNSFALLLCIAIPLIWAVSHRLSRRDSRSRLLVLAAGATMLAIVFIGLAVSASRAGILLGMLALVLSTAMIWSPSTSQRSSRTRRSLFAVLAAALIVGQFGMIGLLRIAETDPVTDYRNQISQVTLRAAADYLPLGSGFGTFRGVYAMHETPATMVSAYINHAHNDWLELWLEGGLPAALVMAGFLVLFAWQGIRVWNPNGSYASHVLPRASSIGVLVLLLHSLVDYPLRMPALICIFAILLAIMLSSPVNSDQMSRRRRRQSERPVPETVTPAGAPSPPAFDVAGSRRLENRPPLS